MHSKVFSKKIVDRVGAGDAYFSVTTPCVFAGMPMDAIGFYYDRKYYDWYETYPYPSRNKLFQEVFLSKDSDIKAIALPKADFLTPEIDMFNININSYENKDFGTIKVYIKK